MTRYERIVVTQEVKISSLAYRNDDYFVSCVTSKDSRWQTDKFTVPATWHVSANDNCLSGTLFVGTGLTLWRLNYFLNFSTPCI